MLQFQSQRNPSVISQRTTMIKCGQQ